MDSCFSFLQYIFHHSSINYFNEINRPESLVVNSILEDPVISNPNSKEMLDNVSTRVNKNKVGLGRVNISDYRQDSRKFLRHMMNIISLKGADHPPAYLFETMNIKNAKVYIYRCEIRVETDPDINFLVFEIAVGGTIEEGTGVSVCSVWVKQMYLISDKRSNITSFGNQRFFSSNLEGLIQKSADYAVQLKGVNNHRPAGLKSASHPGTNYLSRRGYKRHYVHLATWNEKSSDLVRQFRSVMNLPRRYITIPEKEFEWRIYLTICGWIASGMRKACA